MLKRVTFHLLQPHHADAAQPDEFNFEYRYYAYQE